MNCNANSSAALSASISGSAKQGTLHAATEFVQSLWCAHRERAHLARAQSAFAEIDTHTLRDIGAPNWLIAESTSRDDARGLRLIDLYRS